MTPEQWAGIRNHLNTVFHKVTPPVKRPGVEISKEAANVLKELQDEAKKEKAQRRPPFEYIPPAPQIWPAPQDRYWWLDNQPLRLTC